MRKKLSELEKAPVTDDLWKITGRGSEHYKNMNLDSLKEAYDIAQRTSMGRSGLYHNPKSVQTYYNVFPDETSALSTTNTLENGRRNPSKW